MRHARAFLLAAAVWAPLDCGPPHRPPPAGPAQDAAARRVAGLLDRARAAMGDAARLAAAGGLTVEAAGTLDKGAELQGRHPGSQDPGAFREVFAIAPSGRLAYEYREDRYDGTWESLRQIYTENDLRLIVLPDSRRVIELRSAGHADARRRLARRIPPLLFAEMLDRRAELRWAGRESGEEQLALPLPSGGELTMGFDPGRGLLTRVEYSLDMPGLGDARVVWRFSDYAPVNGLGLFPRRHVCTIQGHVYLDVHVSAVASGARPDLLAPPDGFARTGPIDAAAGDASRDAAVEAILPGVYRVTGLRQGFHPMFVEFDDFVVAIDAPAGYPLMTEIPAGDVAPGPSSDWLSERYLALVEQALPAKPVRAVVLTHHHGDHMGGVRAFIARGASVIAPPATAALVERLARARLTIAPDRLSAAPRPPRVEVVRGTHAVSDGRRTLELVDVGRNPHGVEMLVAHLPAERLLFVSDLLDPVASVERYPVASHAALDRFFGAWLARRGLAPDRIYTMHGSGLVTPAHLARLSPAPAGAASVPPPSGSRRARPTPP